MLQISTNEEIIIDTKSTGYLVRQEARGTVVWSRATGKEIKLPQKRYSLSCAKPASKIPGIIDFENDLLTEIGQ